MFISEKDRFVFIHIPKTAGSSIHIALKDHYGLVGPDRADPPPEEHHQSYSFAWQNNPVQDYYSFAFVRNPWDRLTSAYAEFRSASHRMGYPVDPPMSTYSGFEQFCEEFPASAWAQDVHYRPQHTFICWKDRVEVDFVGRYENLVADYAAIGEKLNISLPILGHHRKTVHPDRNKIYTPRTKNIIGDFFAKDIEIFGYDF